MALILHHYETSPFSEVLRLALGLKGATWGSVIIPNIAPKPLLTPLTGGYRKTPVLQDGADIWCDTAAAIEAIEALPGPSLYPAPLGRAGAMLAALAAGPWFVTAVAPALAPAAHALPQAFWDDRKALFGLDRDAFLARAPHMITQFKASMAMLDAALADGRRFLGGDAPGYADLAHYMNVWFQQRFAPDAPTLKPYAAILEWARRVAAIGHGDALPMTGEAALEAARAAEPVVTALVDPASGFAEGHAVTVATEDPGADRVAGTLLRLTDRDIVIRRDDSQVGAVAVHFPRAGQVVRPG